MPSLLARLKTRRGGYCPHKTNKYRRTRVQIQYVLHKVKVQIVRRGNESASICAYVCARAMIFLFQNQKTPSWLPSLDLLPLLPHPPKLFLSSFSLVSSPFCILYISLPTTTTTTTIITSDVLEHKWRASQRLYDFDF